jgi:hypothetical protein
MQAIRGVRAFPSVGLRSPRAEPNQPATGESVECESRALVAIRPVAPIELTRVARPYPLASFLAHLIAVRERAPQTRRRGRTSPADASAAYTARQANAPAPTEIFLKSA